MLRTLTLASFLAQLLCIGGATLAHAQEPSTTGDTPLVTQADSAEVPTEGSGSVGADEAARASAELVVLVPPDVLSEWSAAVQFELGADTSRILMREVTEAEAAQLGDTGLRVSASAPLLWAERAAGDWVLHLFTESLRRAIPLEGDADPRTVALILISLLETAPPPPTLPPVATPVAPTATQAGGEHPPPPAPEEAPSAPWSPSVSLGIQLAADARLEEPLLLAQLGLVFHLRFDSEHSLRVLAAYSATPGIYGEAEFRPEDNPGLDPLPGPGAWASEHAIELRLSEGFRFEPWLEGRLFVNGRFHARHYPGAPPGFIEVDTQDEPIQIHDGRPEQWVESASFGGGTEWIVRPEESRRLEVGVSLGLNARLQYAPDGVMRVRTDYVVVQGGASVGWLFF